jgi:hypothetical protein
VTAIITAQVPNSVYVSRCFDDIQDLLGKTMLLELVSSELDPSESLSSVNSVWVPKCYARESKLCIFLQACLVFELL